MEETVAKDAKVIVGCSRGGRSIRASELLVSSGYTNVVDMRGGYEGEADPMGNITFAGWSRRGLPTTME